MGRQAKKKDVKKGVRIRDWKGLLAGESKRKKRAVFGLLLLVAVGMTFTQLGFVGIGVEGDYLGYVLGLLCPLTLCSLLLGKGSGSLFGLLCGIALFLHSRIQPLDLYEYYFVSYVNSLVLYAFIGFLLGLCFAIALRKNPKRRLLRFFFVAAVVACIATGCFVLNTVIDLIMSIVTLNMESKDYANMVLPLESLNAIASMGGIGIQALFDTVLIFVTAAICDIAVARYYEKQSYEGVRDVFRRRLLVALLVVYIVVQAGSFTAITVLATNSASEDMIDEAEFVGEQIDQNYDYFKDITESQEFSKLPEAYAKQIIDYDPTGRLVDGYGLSDGTLLVLTDDIISYSDNDYYVPGTSLDDYFGKNSIRVLEAAAKKGEMRSMVYGAKSMNELLSRVSSDEEVNTGAGELGYMRVAKTDHYYVLLAQPSSMVFANRLITMHWTALLALTLAVAAFVVASRALNMIVVEPIERINGSLGTIMEGNLDEMVAETGTVEFATFSADINATVDALKGFIDESERRMEHDLATAKAIQESALPSTFPPFPEIDAFDIYASMNAAKEVGGDFYDFFLIDDRTLGFLIADVSGKGIPGALFMMEAKTEIENYMSTGMPPAEAIASANKRLCANNEAGMFVTVWAATLDWVTGELTYVNAGHNFPLIRHGDGGDWEWIKKKCGLFLGTFETAKYRQETIALEQGDELILYTDGVNEAFNVNEEEFGNDRLEAFLACHTYLGPKLLVRRLRAEVAAWAEGAEQSDDITILALEYGAAPEASGTLTLPATLDNLSEAVALVSDELERRLCPLSVQNRVEIALEELFVNVCRYAYAEQDEPGEVTVSYLYRGDPRSISVEIRDFGIPFDPVSYRDPAKPTHIDEMSIGGLGIFMARQSMDEFVYEREGEENVLTFSKGW
ncbi:MAG: SpoIIE family protein phosphatase [Atopobiaceae bacterium]|nr:SpoIIE family protein phosphatase [Atopobiaceae bacterium]